MSELSGPELRKAAMAALGWTRFQSYGNGGGFWHRDGCKKVAAISSCACKGSWYLPQIESKPEISEPMFQEFCIQRDYWWRMSYQGKLVTLAVGRNSNYSKTIADVHGLEPSEARARAIVEASKK